MLRAEQLTAGYGGEPVIRDVSLELEPGQVVALVGANGAGKTTTLRALVGDVPRRDGRVSVEGEVVARRSPPAMLRRGVALVPEGRGIFASLAVLENLRLGAYTGRWAEADARARELLELFPRLAERPKVPGNLLSGGEQQMLAIARALMSRPRYLLLDEPSMGLAPTIVQLLAKVIRREAGEGLGVLLVEQNAEMALGVADWAHVLERGEIVHSGIAADLRADDAIRDAYLGVGTKQASTC